LIWLTALTLLLALLNLPSVWSARIKSGLRELVAPLQETVAGVGQRGRETVQTLRGLGGLVLENRRQAEELTRLRQRAREIGMLEEENAALRDQLSYARRASQRLLAAEVIGRDAAGWWQTIRLNQGARAGVLPDRAVVTSDGLAGKTVAISPNTCEALLLSDPTCQTAVRLPRSGAFGILRGRGAPTGGQTVLQLDFLNRHLAIRPGDEVVTSGLGGVFPAGLLVGYVESARLDRNGLYQTADVLPQADLGRLRYAFIVLDQGEPRAP